MQIVTQGLDRHNSLHESEATYESNRCMVIRVLCDSRVADDSVYRMNGEVLNGELNFVLLPGMETLHLEPTSTQFSPRENQLSRGFTAFYRVVTSLSQDNNHADTVNWNYTKLTHFLRPALQSTSHTVVLSVVDPSHDHEVMIRQEFHCRP